MDKQRAHEFISHERNIAINKNNQLLLSKLVDISNGKWTSVPKINQTTTNSTSQHKLFHQSSAQSFGKKNSHQHSSTHFAVGSGINLVRSLNLAVRKRETERIERENQAFAKRLFEKQPYFDRKSLDEGWKQHLRLKKRIKKVEIPKPLPEIKKTSKRINETSPSP